MEKAARSPAIQAQGTVEPSCGATTNALHAQGATEYLVLLAAVLIIALVSIALLGFYPGLSQDATMQQSEVYWKSARPLSVQEAVAYRFDTSLYGGARPYLYTGIVAFRIRNNGANQIRITKILWEGGSTTQAIDWQHPTYPMANLSTKIIPPGGEVCFSKQAADPDRKCAWNVAAVYPASETETVKADFGLNFWIGASKRCPSPRGGAAEFKDFGFEYVEIVNGVEITKKFRGIEPLMFRCTEDSP